MQPPTWLHTGRHELHHADLPVSPRKMKPPRKAALPSSFSSLEEGRNLCGNNSVLQSTPFICIQGNNVIKHVSQVYSYLSAIYNFHMSRRILFRNVWRRGRGHRQEGEGATPACYDCLNGVEFLERSDSDACLVIRNGLTLPKCSGRNNVCVPSSSGGPGSEILPLARCRY